MENENEQEWKIKEKTEGLQKKINELFPELWKETEVTLASIGAMRLKELNDPLTIVFTGAASSGKTTILSFLYPRKEDTFAIWNCKKCDYPHRQEKKPQKCDNCTAKIFEKEIKNESQYFKSDNFTPRSFVSHAANMKEEKLEEVDLLPKITNKIFLTPELAPIFGKSKEDLIENFSIMARVLDGEGYESDSGSRGHRGYTGKYRFVWLGATTPLAKSAWDTMANIGHRILFVKMDSIKKTVDDYAKIFLHEKPYAEKIEEIRLAVKEFNDEISKTDFYSIEWDRKQDEVIFKKIVRAALLVVRLRAKIGMWKEETEDGEVIYNYTTPLPEAPERLISALYNLARGRALVYGRNYLDETDLELVYRVALSSMPFERADFFIKLICTKGGVLSTEEVERIMKCTKPTARKIMQSLEVLGVCEAAYDSLDNTNTKRMQAISILPEFTWVLKDEKVKTLFWELREAERKALEEEAQKKIGVAPLIKKPVPGCSECREPLESGKFSMIGELPFCENCMQKREWD